MRFMVVRKKANGYTVIAMAMYLEDAESVLSNCHQGYIADSNGEIVKTKGVEL